MKYLLVALICALFLSSCIFAAGSYANSESYIVDIPYKDSETIMRKLKETYPEYRDYFYPTYKSDSTLVKIISTVKYTKNDTIVEDEYIYKYEPQDNYFVNSKNDTIRYQVGDSIPVLDENGFIQFYLRNIGYSVSCRVVFRDDPKQTRVLLVSAYDKKNKKFKSINTGELTKEENNRIKKEFEKEILPKLGDWEHYANAFFRFLGLH